MVDPLAGIQEHVHKAYELAVKYAQHYQPLTDHDMMMELALTELETLEANFRNFDATQQAKAKQEQKAH